MKIVYAAFLPRLGPFSASLELQSVVSVLLTCAEKPCTTYFQPTSQLLRKLGTFETVVQRTYSKYSLQ